MATTQDPPRLQWLKTHRYVKALLKDKHGVAYTSELGFFRCLATHLEAGDLEGKSRQLFQKYREHYDDADRPHTSTDPQVRARDQPFNGLNIFSELDKLERLYQIRINVYRVGACHPEPEGVVWAEDDKIESAESIEFCPALVARGDPDVYPDSMCLLAYGAHLCYITDVFGLSKHVACGKCQKSVHTRQHHSHFKRCRGAETRILFNKKTYSVSRTLAEECALRGVQLEKDLQYRPAFLVWDCETYCPSDPSPEDEEEAGIEIPCVRDDLYPGLRSEDINNVSALTALLREGDAEVDPRNTLTNTSNTQYSTPHTLLSIACASNVPGYTECRVFVTEGDSQELFDRFMNYCAEVQVAAGLQLAPAVRRTVQELLRVEEKEKTDLWDELDAALEERLQTRMRRVVEGEADEYDTEEDDGSDDEDDLVYGATAFDEGGLNVELEADDEERRLAQAERPRRRGRRSVSSLIGRLTSQCRVLPLISYNGSGFDEVVCAKYLLPYFNSHPPTRKHPDVSDEGLHQAFFPPHQKRKNTHLPGGRPPKRSRNEQPAWEAVAEGEENESGGWEDGVPPKIIKRGSRFLLLQNARFKMLDVCHYIAAGTPYAKYIQGYDCKDEKLSFPYEFVKSLEDLEYPQLPSREQFYNTLKQKECEQSDYDKCVALWHDKGMTKFRHYLEAYNASDVIPFVEALQKQKNYFKEEHGIHLFDHVSLPSIADRILHHKTPHGTWFSTLAHRDADLHDSFNRALQGGMCVCVCVCVCV